MQRCPFDVDITIAEDAEYAICYDTTIEGCAKQIRFMNWGDAKVYLTKEQFSTLFSGAEDVLYSGQCGKNVEYELNKKASLHWKELETHILIVRENQLHGQITAIW